MKPVSDRSRWENGLGASHQPLIEVTHVGTGSMVPIESGSVTIDSTSDVRTRAEVNVPGADWAPLSEDAPLAPANGNEVQIRRGILFPNGDRMLVSLGIFVINAADLEDEPGTFQTQLTLADRSQFVIDALFEDDGEITGGTNFWDAVLDVVTEGYPSVQSRLPTTTSQTPTITYARGDNRWDFAQNMAASLGYEAYFDGDGFLTARPIPDVGVGADVSLVEGGDGVEVKPMLLSASQRWSRDLAFNKWIWTGDNVEGTDEIVGEAVDDDPSSPTYYSGPFGHKPKIESSTFIADATQAQQAANGSKAKNRGVVRSVNFGSLVNPALEPGDVARITRSQSGLDEDHIIDTLTIPLSLADGMSGTTRATAHV